MVWGFGVDHFRGEDDNSEFFIFIFAFGFWGWYIEAVRIVRIELASLNAKLVSVTGEEKDETREKNWHLKAISIVQSEWAEVIYLVRLLHPIHPSIHRLATCLIK